MSQIKDRSTLVEALRNRVKAAAEKAATNKPPVSDHGNEIDDPTEKGTVNIPKDPANDPKKMQTPPDGKNGEAEKSVETGSAGLNPAGAGEGTVPKAKDGNAEDEKETNAMKSGSLADRFKGIAERLKTAASKKVEEADTKKADAKKAETKKAEEVAADLNPGFTLEHHVKLASMILDTDEGRKWAEGVLAESAGYEVAQEYIKQAAANEEAYRKMASAEYQAALQIQQIQEQAARVFQSASKEDQETIIKLAAAHNYNLSKLETEAEKLAYMAGAEDAAALMDAEASGVDPMSQIPDDITVEELEMVLMEMIQAGEITEEEAEAILMAFMAEMEGADAGGAVDPAAEEAALLEAMPELGKVASIVEKIAK